MMRPVGVSAGGLGLLFAWLGGLVVAELTGATPVVIMLAAGVVLFAAAVVDGLVSALRTEVIEISLPPTSVQGENVSIAGVVRAPRPVFVEFRSDDEQVAEGWTSRTDFAGSARFVHRGQIEELEVRFRTAGLLGLVWWGRRRTLSIGRHLVAAPAAGGAAPAERIGVANDGDLSGAAGAVSGHIDGIRPWRDGDSEKFVHWASTLRSGELLVHDRRHDADERWVVRARSGTPDPDAEAGLARGTMEQGLRSGAQVSVAVDDGEPISIESADDAAAWSATASLGVASKRRTSWRDRLRRTEPDATATVSARWWAAATTLVSLWMLSGALGYSPAMFGAIALGVAMSAAVSARSVTSGEEPSTLVRALVGAGALGGFVMVAAASGRLDGLLAVLRGPLPQVLVLLILLHGFECRDRRTIRVSLGISAVVLMYASGLRVDGTIAWWLLAWALAFGVTMAKLSGPTARPPRRMASLLGSTRGWVFGTASIGLGCAATIGVLAAVPVPDGAARLTLPTLIEDADDVPRPGAVTGPDGEVRDAGDVGDGQRAPAGQAGGYTGFAESMDTSVRGDLSDEIVMRVRASEPDFWRGQTFSEFDGRRWFADEELGSLRSGPNINVTPALGDIAVADDVETERFVQTYFLEADMPNVIFHSSRPHQVIADTDVWVRPDSALRANSVLPDGSIYTVVSDRVRVDDQILRRQGFVGDRLSDLGKQVFDKYLTVPASTSAETIALADELSAAATSTYDVVRAYEAWMNANVEYDLNAPLPDAGEDAVHDFLFDSKLGFCEQIASSLTIMLRTQGVPARLVTGYVSGTRDEVAGVFEVRARDAHAWVEVWFPETGWQAFDPTASVPLSADAEIDSVGADLVGSASGFVGERPLQVVLVGGAVVAAMSLIRFAGVFVVRRRRGRWGLLQDRFARLARERGGPEVAANPALAESWTETDDAAVARLVAERLDRIAFDPLSEDDDHLFDETDELVGTLARSSWSGRRSGRSRG